eukprot:15349701-Ditylum_brightwellii.AAC.1
MECHGSFNESMRIFDVLLKRNNMRNESVNLMKAHIVHTEGEIDVDMEIKNLMTSKMSRTFLFAISLLQEDLKRRQKNGMNENTLLCVKNGLKTRATTKMYKDCDTFEKTGGNYECKNCSS